MDAHRHASERAALAAAPEKPKRKCRRGVYASDMSLVTDESAASRGGGWKVTPMGRVVWAVKMRPERPLPDPSSVLPAGSSGKGGKKRKKVKEPDVRARRRKIDMTRWGSTHLSGVWLDALGAVREAGDEERRGSVGGVEQRKEGFEGGRSSGDVIMENDVIPMQPVTIPGPVSQPVQDMSAVDGLGIAAEKMASLSLLASLFGDKEDGEDDWVGRESVGSDVDEAALLRGEDQWMGGEEAVDFEEVPRDDGGRLKETKKTKETKKPLDVKQPSPPSKDTVQQTANERPNGLKDLFAPKEDDGSLHSSLVMTLIAHVLFLVGFSLLGHLDLDLELDDDVPFPTASTPNEPAPVANQTLVASSSKSDPTALAPATLAFNPKKTLFFPAVSKPKGLKDIFDIAQDKKWSWRDPQAGFFRMGTEAEIRARWEEEKGELTRGWKKRCREAGKVRRRKGGGKEGDE